MFLVALGTWCFGNAFRNRKDSYFAFAYTILHESKWPVHSNMQILCSQFHSFTIKFALLVVWFCVEWQHTTMIYLMLKFDNFLLKCPLLQCLTMTFPHVLISYIAATTSWSVKADILHKNCTGNRKGGKLIESVYFECLVMQKFVSITVYGMYYRGFMFQMIASKHCM